MEDEQLFRELLEELPDSIIQTLLIEYISKNNLHSVYIELITKLNKDFIDNTNDFIVKFKRSVNTLYTDKLFNKKVLKNVDIDKENWFWYARLLKHTEDKKYPSLNYFQPVYLLKRLKPITDELEEKDLRDEEFKDLYKCLLELYKEYNVIKEVEEKNEN